MNLGSRITIVNSIPSTYEQNQFVTHELEYRINELCHGHQVQFEVIHIFQS